MYYDETSTDLTDCEADLTETRHVRSIRFLSVLSVERLVVVAWASFGTVQGRARHVAGLVFCRIDTAGAVGAAGERVSARSCARRAGPRVHGDGHPRSVVRFWNESQ